MIHLLYRLEHVAVIFNHWVVVLSKDPKELERDVTMIREVESALGSYESKISEGDIAKRKKWPRYLVAYLVATTG